MSGTDERHTKPKGDVYLKCQNCGRLRAVTSSVSVPLRPCRCGGPLRAAIDSVTGEATDA